MPAGELRHPNLVRKQTAHTCVKTLLKNERVAKCLEAKHAEINTEFQNMVVAVAV